MECVGGFLGPDADKHLFACFARHCRRLFPALAQTHRTTFARQAADFWHPKEMIWRRLVGEVALAPPDQSDQAFQSNWHPPFNAIRPFNPSRPCCRPWPAPPQRTALSLGTATTAAPP